MNRLEKTAVVLNASAIVFWLLVLFSTQGSTSLLYIAAYGMAIAAVASPQTRFFRIVAATVIAATGIIGTILSIAFLLADGPWTGGAFARYGLSIAFLAFMVVAPVLSTYVIGRRLRKTKGVDGGQTA